MLTHYVKGELNTDQPTLIMLHGFISDHTTFHLVEDKIVNNDINIIEIDLDNSKIYGKNFENPNIKVDKNSLSYIIYTSGSTRNS